MASAHIPISQPALFTFVNRVQIVESQGLSGADPQRGHALSHIDMTFGNFTDSVQPGRNVDG
jgi:hypothetical protein